MNFYCNCTIYIRMEKFLYTMSNKAIVMNIPLFAEMRGVNYFILKRCYCKYSKRNTSQISTFNSTKSFYGQPSGTKHEL